MLDIDDNRILNMTNGEKRWLDNIKKAFYESDLAIQRGAPEDRSLEELFKAVDTAKTLRCSLRNEKISHYNNKEKFIEFLGLEIPCTRPDSPTFELWDAKSNILRNHTLGEIIYDIRCMIHENENLNVAENVDHYILLDWSVRDLYYPGKIENKQFICNGFFLWNRLRQVLSKFITGIEGVITLATENYLSITIEPAIGSIRPIRKIKNK